MIDFNEAITVIRDNNGFEANKKDSSYYRVYTVPNQRPLQVRISNHGTHLWTWDENAEYVPHRGYNISIVFMSSSKGYSDSNTTVNMDIFEKDANGQKIKIGTKPNFEVIQYVYDCDLLTPNNVARINQFIQQIPRYKKFIDPMKSNPKKHAKVYKLTPNNASEVITENNNTKNMKNRIRLTESQLHRVIKESVKQVLSELDWKTYANAAKKRALQGNDDKAHALDDAATKSFNRKYEDEMPFARGNIATVYSPERGYNRQFGKISSSYLDQQPTIYDKSLTDPEDWHDSWTQVYKGRYNDDMRDYFSGKSKYTKENGWG